MASKYCDRVKSCKHSWWCAADYNPERDNHECFVKLTNADRIRAMSDEELAVWVVGIHPENCPFGQYDYYECIRTDCDGCWLDWLKSPMEVEE